MAFTNRKQAGQLLAKALEKACVGESVVVYALPRGGVILASEVATKLQAPLELAIARKISPPTDPEYAVAAVTEQGKPVINPTETACVHAPWFQTALQMARAEAQRRREVYLGTHQPPASLTGKTAIVVDDGMATGLTMMAVLAELRHLHPKRIVVAVPVAAPSAAHRLRRLADEVLILDTPAIFRGGIGAYYEDFPQVSDPEVIAALSSFHSPSH